MHLLNGFALLSSVISLKSCASFWTGIASNILLKTIMKNYCWICTLVLPCLGGGADRWLEVMGLTGLWQNTHTPPHAVRDNTCSWLVISVLDSRWSHLGSLTCERRGDAYPLSKGCKLWILVLLRVSGIFFIHQGTVSFRVVCKQMNSSYSVSACVRMASLGGQKGLEPCPDWSLLVY